MNRIFQETFDTSLNGLPGGWHVERNSDLKEVPAIRKGENCIEYLSAGNKYLPIIPELTDFLVDCTFSFSLKAALKFGVMISFSYDPVSGRGETLRISCGGEGKETVLEYGTMRANLFTALEKKSFQLDTALFNAPFDVKMELKGKILSVKTLGIKAAFKVKGAPGMIAISRDHFYDILKLTKMEIYGTNAQKGREIGRFTVSMPEDITFYPIYCDVVLTDYGNCLDASLKWHGSSQETEAGEGNYHGMRTDKLIRPYLKVFTPEKIDKYVIFERDLLLCVQSLVRPHFYERIYKRPPWPLLANVRFMKPEGKFDLAIGAENYVPATLRHMAQTPSETIFDLKGNVLYSGLGITDDERIKCEFFSQKKKKMMAKIPKTDPRYKEAITFLENNHYFFEKEDAHFHITLKGKGPLPCKYEVILEDAYFRPLKKLRSKALFSTDYIGVTEINTVKITFDAISNLSCGVYHLRVKSLDPTFSTWNDYCAFEVMGRGKNALCPPLASGLPYIYNGRTETRGLLTDGMEVWKGKSTDLPHYHACSNFLPKAARDFDVIPTIHAYGREFFLWLGSRCSDDPIWRNNKDLIAKADFLNICPQFNQFTILWRYVYGGRRLIRFYELAKSLNDPEFDLAEMEETIRKMGDDRGNGKEIPSAVVFKDGVVSLHNFMVMAKKYWEKWLDVFNEDMSRQHQEVWEELKKLNPSIRYSMYGPAHIYVGHLKGHDFSRYLGTDKIPQKLMGFWQYEDYPFACRYGLERGSYFLTAYLMNHPGARIYPEIYTAGGIQGCPDGAVFFAHPPQGCRPDEYPCRIMRQSLEFVYASSYFSKGKFHFWEERGFQACDFTRAWFESLLETWRIVDEHAPAAPWRSPAFVSSDGSRRAHNDLIISMLCGDAILDVRNPAAEDVPCVYEETRKNALCNGFQVMEEELLLLTEKETSLLVLPPVKGMAKETLAHIRKLHKKGVSLLAFEDVEGLEDLFGVKDTGVKKTVTKVTGKNGFCGNDFEICDDDNCKGSYKAEGAKILLDAEIPVLTIQKNGKSSAAFFNVSPQLIKGDRLHLRMGHGKDNISDFLTRAVKEVIFLLAAPEVFADKGRLMACKTVHGEDMVILCNEDDKNANTITVTVKRAPGRRKLLSCGAASCELPGEKGYMTIRVRLEPGKGTYMIFG